MPTQSLHLAGERNLAVYNKTQEALRDAKCRTDGFICQRLSQQDQRGSGEAGRAAEAKRTAWQTLLVGAGGWSMSWKGWREERQKGS